MASPKLCWQRYFASASHTHRGCLVHLRSHPNANTESVIYDHKAVHRNVAAMTYMMDGTTGPMPPMTGGLQWLFTLNKKSKMFVSVDVREAIQSTQSTI
jgi:hypothetical protein